MKTIELNISDSIYDNVMFFLSGISKNDITIIKKETEQKSKKKNSIVDFFQDSPLVDNIILERDNQIYNQRLSF
jgi:hypothetical protein